MSQILKPRKMRLFIAVLSMRENKNSCSGNFPHNFSVFDTATFTSVKILSLVKETWKVGASASWEALRKAKETNPSSSKPSCPAPPRSGTGNSSRCEVPGNHHCPRAAGSRAEPWEELSSRLKTLHSLKVYIDAKIVTN